MYKVDPVYEFGGEYLTSRLVPYYSDGGAELGVLILVPSEKPRYLIRGSIAELKLIAVSDT